MEYSLINVSKEYDGFVDGVGLQDCTGSLEETIQRARESEKANGNQISVAVVDSLLLSYPDYSHRTGLKRLD